MEEIDYIRVYIDDILVWGSTREEHDSRLEKVLDVIKSNNLNLNKHKCEIGVNERTFLGDRLTHRGVKPDNSKLKAIQDMKCPENKDDIPCTLGLINYLS